jgi:NifU-like protein involved in Fe-S cluster formation
MITKDSYVHMKCPVGITPLSEFNFSGISGVAGQGYYYLIKILFKEEKIGAISFETYCCPWANAVGSAICKLALGKSAQDAIAISATQVNTELGGVPRDKRDLPTLAVNALQNALERADRQLGLEKSESSTPQVSM